MIHNGQNKTPLHTFIAQSIHDTCKSKKLIQIMNRLGLCICNRVPIPKNITSSSIIHGATDNFDHEENTSSGIGGSHDTILMLFQNGNISDGANNTISEKTADENRSSANKRSLHCILDCQKLIKMGRFSNRGEIPNSFIPSRPADLQDIINNSDIRYETWINARYFSNSDNSRKSHCIPSFSASNSFLHDMQPQITTIAFTPIIPHPATDYDTIYTVMKNFQDVLSQKHHQYGPLWCDEGVYRLPKELQLLNPVLFSNIFLGLGGFHMEKVIIACCGKYLEDVGVDSIFVENEVYGPAIVNTVMNGGNYVRGIHGMAILSEVLHILLLKQFTSTVDNSHDEIKHQVHILHQLIVESKFTAIKVEWDKLSEIISDHLMQLDWFRQEGRTKSNQFLYWDTFLKSIYPVLRDLTRSHREADWELHLSAVQRALPLVFAFDRTNYKRWLPLYYEDCLSLQSKYPLIYESFMQGGFVAKLTQRKGSAIPMDQALESKYNKPAESSSGVIGMTRRKEAVCKWNLVKHEKSRYTGLLSDIYGISNEDEYSLHHEFSLKRTEADEKCVEQLGSYIAKETILLM